MTELRSVPTPEDRDVIDWAAELLCQAYEKYAPVPAVLRSEATNIVGEIAKRGLFVDVNDDEPEDSERYVVLREFNRSLGWARDRYLGELTAARGCIAAALALCDEYRASNSRLAGDMAEKFRAVLSGKDDQ